MLKLLIIHFILSASNPTPCNIPIYVDLIETDVNYGAYFDTIRSNGSDSTMFIYYVENCNGAMSFKFYKNNVLFIQGKYSNSLDTFTRYISKIDVSGSKEEIQIEKYFYPLRDGVWYYWDKERILKVEKYVKGILKEN